MRPIGSRSSAATGNDTVRFDGEISSFCSAVRSLKNSPAVECNAMPSPRKCVLNKKKSKSRISSST